jgi:site-specific DNA-adenine methylase
MILNDIKDKMIEESKILAQDIEDLQNEMMSMNGETKAIERPPTASELTQLKSKLEVSP